MKKILLTEDITCPENKTRENDLKVSLIKKKY